MSRSQDTVIDDDEETCPLCIEEFDLSDKNFKPCPCGYQICQFCFNSLKTTYEKSTCPNCRRPYDDATIQYKIPTAEEFKLDQMNKNKKQAAAKRKETEKREVETSTRRNLAGVRVKQQNLVYVIGLEPTKKDESMLLETLRGKDYFGQYGEIEKIVVSKAKPGATNQGIGVYVTFKRKEDAATCIEAVDGSQNGERILRAQYGTTKYCSAFLRGETCMNKNCSFLHETGEDAYHTSLQNESSDTRHNVRTPLHSQTSSHRTGTTPQPGAVSQSMARQNSIDTVDSRKGSSDISALPASAGWANINNAPTARVRRASLVASTPSPQLTHAILSTKSDQTKPANTPITQQSAPASSNKAASSISRSSTTTDPTPEDSTKTWTSLPSKETPFDRIRRAVTTDFVGFNYDDSWMTPEERARIADLPPLYDPFGGAKRRLMEDKEAAERARMDSEAKAKLEAQAKSAAEDALDDDQMAAGSLALGGEPEDNPRSTSARGTIGRPNQTASTFGEQFLNARSLTPQQRQQLALLNASGVQAPGLPQPPAQNTAFEMSDFDRRGPQYSQAQYDQINNHQRHGSRYFNNDSKTTNNNRFQGQQQQPFYSSGVQGPPPGLPTAGTPPVSGGGMFAHGQGFTNTGFGASKDGTNDLHLRGRSGTNTGHDMSKRGGVEHLADPSILQARIHQGGASGQGLFGGNQVDTSDFPPLPTRSDTRPEFHSRVSSMQSYHGSGLRASTPKVPPGFENAHAHPTALHQERISGRTSPARTFTGPTIPAVPSFAQSVPTPQSRLSPPKSIQESTQKPLRSEIKTTNEATNLGSAGFDSLMVKTTGQPSEDSTMHLERPPLDSHPAAGTKIEPVDAKLKAVTHPLKIDIPATTATDMKASDGIAPTSSKIETPILESTVVATPEVLPSRPVSPGTTASEVSRSSTARPRTLRLTTSMIQQAEAARIASPAMTEKSATVPALSHARREHSRQPSLSSISRSRPSSPSASDRLMSQDVSRAGSPPPGGIVGSAPSRIKSKAQTKKDRKEKAKKAEADEASTTGQAATPLVEEVGPIIARQKKQKKSKTSTSVVEESPVAIENKPEQKLSRQASVELDNTARDDSPLKELPSEKLESEQQPVPPAKSVAAVSADHSTARYKVRDLYTHASRHPNTPTALQGLLSSHVSPMTKLLNELVASGDLAKDHPWLSNPSFNSSAYKLPPDLRRGQEYLDANGYSSNNTFGYLYIDQKDKKELRNGGFVREFSSPDRPDDSLNSFLLTSRGWVMRHLNVDEAERVQELEYKRSLYEKQFGEFGSMAGLGVLEQDDFTNLGGGLNALIHNGPRHGVHWVMDEIEVDQDNDYADQPDATTYERMGGDELLVDFPADDIDDETDDDDVGPGLIGSDTSVPGTRDTGFSSATGEAGPGLQSLNTIASNHVSKSHNVNLRAIDTDSLSKRIQEKHREMDSTKKEMDKTEKTLTRKGKEFGRWRDALLKT